MAPGSRLNVLLTDGEQLVATTWTHSLRVRRTADSVTVSSEPFGPGDWDDVPDRSLLVATATTLRITPMEGRQSDPSIDVHLTPDYAARALREDARAGLTADPKWLPPKWFYDARGSELFEEITRLPEYYPTRAEREILQARAGEIAAITKAHTLVELGSGSSEKTRLLLDGLRDRGTLTTFVPLDVSESALREAADAINADYPALDVHGVVGDFTAHLDKLPGDPPRIVAFLGGTIGNLLPGRARDLLRVDPRRPRARRVAAARHRPGEGSGHPGRGVRRQRGRDRGVQPERAAGDQPAAGRGLRRGGVQPRGDLGRRERVDRDAPARRPGDAGADPRDPPRGRLRRGRGAPAPRSPPSSTATASRPNSTKRASRRPPGGPTPKPASPCPSGKPSRGAERLTGSAGLT